MVDTNPTTTFIGGDCFYVLLATTALLETTSVSGDGYYVLLATTALLETTSVSGDATN